MFKKYFWHKYYYFNEKMNYYLFTPKTKNDRPKPLIIWLHGSGEIGVNKKSFFSEGLPYALSNWNLKPFNAYILCPHLMIEDEMWELNNNSEYVSELIEKIIYENNIDRNKIILCGHSLGAMGATYLVEKRPDLFSCLCLLSSYKTEINLENINIPTLGIVGITDEKEDEESVSFMWSDFKNRFGEESLWELPCSHADVPKIAFLDDANLDGKSDLISWMLKNKKNSY